MHTKEWVCKKVVTVKMPKGNAHSLHYTSDQTLVAVPVISSSRYDPRARDQ
jgi:hypothetical protein